MSEVLQSPTRMELDPTVRTLQIEAEGDRWKGLIKPKIRLMGRWLEQAGFRPGLRVQVTCVAPGVIELRSPDALIQNETERPSSAQPDAPF
ncbi:MAG: SymE family type I addiction module toxin [Candidatus Solibacter sp.]|nr:SymE family type I addiction module toxin [Candidatus Solibacter sp.]